jgi:HAE1 family hydrophobic/amphiphilic exporter-1
MMIRLTRFALRFRTVTLLVVVLLIVAGAVAVTQMNRELFPSLDAPFLVVFAVEPGAGPNVVDQDLASPIEAVLRATEGVQHVQATSLEGIALVTAQYKFGTDMDAIETATQRDLAQARFPQGVSPPQLQRLNPDSFPIYSLAISGDDPDQLQTFVSEALVPTVEGVSGVATVEVAGVTSQVVMVVLDPDALSASRVTTSDVTAALTAANVSVPAGGLTTGGFALPVRVVSSATNLDEVRAIPVRASGNQGSASVSLGDLGTVEVMTGGAGTSISRLDGEPAVTLSVVKAQDANTVGTVEEIEAVVNDLEVPSGVRVQTIINQAPEIQNGITELARDAALGAGLAVLVILLFLRSFRGTLVSGVSIPLSLLVASVIMWTDNISLNILTLGALSVAAGRVIDDAIVVLENIHRLLDEGLERTEAVLVGTRQMVPAITASTLTTVAVFLPLAFVGGLVGEVFVGFALTVTFALLASLFVAVTVVPVLAQSFLRRSHTPEGDDAGAREEAVMRRVYRRPLRWALAHRWLVVVTAFVLLLGSLFSLTGVDSNLFPSGEPDALQVSINAPPGTSLEATSAQVVGVEEAIGQLEGVELFTTVIGSSADGLAALFGGGGGGSNSARIMVRLAKGADADALTASIEQAIVSSGLFGAVAPLVESGPGGSDLSVQVTGKDFAAVVAGAGLVAEKLAAVDGVDEVSSNVAFGRPEFVVEVDERKAASMGLNAQALAGIVRSRLTPTPATTVILDGAPMQVIVAMGGAAIANPDQLAALTVAPGVTLGDVAEIRQADSPAAVTRYDGERSAEVKGVITTDNIGLVTQNVTTVLGELDLPAGVSATQGGVAELFAESFGALLTAMVIAVALVYLTMVSTFGSLLTPFVILLTLPLAAIGAFPALLVTGRDLSLTSLLGVLMLIGIVVTNAIVMLEFVERLKREEGLSTYDALLEGAAIRLRPILMTALVTIFALMPLALGLSEGALLSSSLATVVIGGLFSSTLLTLLVIPCVYSLITDSRAGFRR